MALVMCTVLTDSALLGIYMPVPRLCVCQGGRVDTMCTDITCIAVARPTSRGLDFPVWQTCCNC